MSNIPLHEKTNYDTAALFGEEVHPRRVKLRNDGIDMVADTHRSQLSASGIDISRLPEFSVLECGGTGRDALAWVRLGAGHVTHVDLAEGNVQRLRDYCSKNDIGNLEAKHGDLLKIDLPAQAFDIVRSRGVMFILADPALGLARYARWCKVGGYVHFNCYRGGTYYYYGVKLLREALKHSSQEKIIAAADRLKIGNRQTGIMLDDLCVPHMHNANARKVNHDLAVADLEPIWPEFRDWKEIDHEIRYPDMPEKVEHIQYWLIKRKHHEDAAALAEKMLYRVGEDDVAAGLTLPYAKVSHSAYQRFLKAAPNADAKAFAEALVRIYCRHQNEIATVAMTGEKRHRLLAEAFDRESEQLSA